MRRPALWALASLVVGSWVIGCPAGWAMQAEGERSDQAAEDLSDAQRARLWNIGVEPWHPELVQPEHSGPALTIQLGRGEALVVPPHLAAQQVHAVYDPYSLSGLGDCVFVGLNAWTGGHQIPQAYVLVYRRQEGGWRLAGELPLRMHFERMETLELGGTSVLVIYGQSGMHFTDLWIYAFEEGVPRLLLQTGSAAGVYVRPAMGRQPAAVWVAIENWDDPTWGYASKDPLWNVHAWDGERFVFSEALSTTRETSVEERTQRFVDLVLKAMKD